MFEDFLALAAGLMVGAIVTACKLPLPAPPALVDVLGVLGVFLGGEFWKLTVEKIS